MDAMASIEENINPLSVCYPLSPCEGEVVVAAESEDPEEDESALEEEMANTPLKKNPLMRTHLQNVPLMELSSEGMSQEATPIQGTPTRGRRNSSPGHFEVTPSKRIISQQGERQRWEDILGVREKKGKNSPLHITANPLRLFEAEEVKEVTGHSPSFKVDMADPFLSTPEQRKVRRYYQQPSVITRSLSFDTMQPMQLRHQKSIHEMQITYGQSRDTPSFASLGAFMQWLVVDASPDKQLIFAYSFSHVMSPDELLDYLQQLFIEDKSESRQGRAGVLSFLSQVLTTLKFQQFVLEHSFMNRLQTWILAISNIYDKMRLRNYSKLSVYRLAPRLKQSISLLFLSNQELSRKHKAMVKRVYTFGLQRVRSDADQIAQYACLGEPTEPESVPYIDVLQQDSKLRSFLNDMGTLSFGEQQSSKHVTGFTELEPSKLAAAMTYLDICQLRCVTVHDLLRGSRKGPIVDTEGARNPIVAITRHWNRLSTWVSLTILTLGTTAEGDLIKFRARVIERFIKLASELFKLSNFNSMFAVMMGLSSPAITTLKDVWKAVNSKHMDTFNKLESKLSPRHNFQGYREILNARKVVIPWLAITLKDLTGIMEGNQKTNSFGWVNVERLELIGQQLRALHESQHAMRPKKMPSKRALFYLTHLPNSEGVDQEQMYRASREAKSKDAHQHEMAELRKSSNQVRLRLTKSKIVFV